MYNTISKTSTQTESSFLTTVTYYYKRFLRLILHRYIQDINVRNALACFSIVNFIEKSLMIFVGSYVIFIVNWLFVSGLIVNGNMNRTSSYVVQFFGLTVSSH